jgi:putative ABC transport system substrate-binding protein
MTRLAVALLSFAFLTAPLAVEGQVPGKVSRIAIITEAPSVAETVRSPAYFAFVQGLGELGYVEGRTILFELRSAEGRSERVPEIVAVSRSMSS